MPRPTLKVESLCKSYGSKPAVQSVSFQVEKGEVVGLLGPNGAGKTTIINMILSVLEPSSGNISIEGINLASHREQALLRTNFAAVYAPLPGNLTVEQNLRVFGLLYGVDELEQRIETLMTHFELIKLRHQRCGALSTGEQTLACLAKAMLNTPALLLLDEPTASLDPSRARDIRSKIRKQVADTQCGVLWTSHNMNEVEDTCDRVLFLSQGKILLEGNPRTLPAEYGKATLEELFIAVAREPLSLNR